METMPRNAKIGSALGFLGGIISMICLALLFKPEDTAIVDMGVYMLIAVMFFALAGGFSRSGQWLWSVLLFMTFMTIAAVCCAVIFGAIDLHAAIVLVVVGVLIVASLSMPSAKTWANRMRI
ncbi:MAG: hypothetical protein LBU30_02790 [Candidatus Methanoplasma sp.]|nr:hypothetical protein [Candidatus Methanoplasma sp.]